MALETANKIDQLVVTNPAAADPLKEGADHLRVIKTEIKGSFPNFGDVPSADSGIVTLTADDINALPQALIDENAAMQAEIAALVPHVVPQGAITMWSGSLASVPAGWGLCDGAFDANLGANKPDLRDKFIVGAGSTYAVGDTGGSVSKTTGSAGSHDHGGTTGDHALAVAEIPKHRHYMFADTELTQADNWNLNKPPGDASVSIYVRNTSASDYEISKSWQSNAPVPSPVEGLRGPEPSLGLTSFAKESDGSDPTGYGEVHAHSIAADGAHTHSITNALPPYFALAFIIKTTAYEDPTP